MYELKIPTITDLAWVKSPGARNVTRPVFNAVNRISDTLMKFAEEKVRAELCELAAGHCKEVQLEFDDLFRFDLLLRELGTDLITVKGSRLELIEHLRHAIALAEWATEVDYGCNRLIIRAPSAPSFWDRVRRMFGGM